MMKKAAAVLLCIAFTTVNGFQVTSGLTRIGGDSRPSLNGPTSFQLFESSPNTETDSDATVSKAQRILDEFHASNLPFRIVVIGNGAILETTSKLGPKSKSSVSPKTGDKLLTFASEDASFEFHVKVDQITKITFVTSERPLPDGESKTMRVSRFLNEKGEPMCSLILADSSDESAQWFDGMNERYGQEVNL
uniref:PH domain-containing protein n=1 Tax=Skeletonema marinoi TaxID=267567 RepID=A0A7S2KKF8_9STRA|mmetsp:Transcript_14116/g.23612  ORF Transcript_14116/g.23612 Transcript_14116/m.23612 type:complete len:192 (+) Transcript_14116:45-620(+)